MLLQVFNQMLLHLTSVEVSREEEPTVHKGSKHQQTFSFDVFFFWPSNGKPGWGEGLQSPLGNPPEQLASLWGRHGVAALQQVCDDQGPLGAGRLDPHATVHPHQQLKGNQLPQFGADLALRGQEPAGEGHPRQCLLAWGLCSRALRSVTF